MQGVKIYLLGSFRLTVNGSDLPKRSWGKRKAKLLVQVLAIHPLHEMHREELIELLFPELEIKQANENFYRILHAARKALEPERAGYSPSNFLLTEGQQIILTQRKGDLWIDAEEFARLAQKGFASGNRKLLESAVELYGGDLLADEPFEEWTHSYRENLKMLFQMVLWRLADRYLREEKPEEAHRWLDRILQIEPADECAHRAKMRLFRRQGKSALALKQYEKCRQILQREFEVEPDEETIRLRQKIFEAKRK